MKNHRHLCLKHQRAVVPKRWDLPHGHRTGETSPHIGDSGPSTPSRVEGQPVVAGQGRGGERCPKEKHRGLQRALWECPYQDRQHFHLPEKQAHTPHTQSLIGPLLRQPLLRIPPQEVSSPCPAAGGNGFRHYAFRGRRARLLLLSRVSLLRRQRYACVAGPRCGPWTSELLPFSWPER